MTENEIKTQLALGTLKRYWVEASFDWRVEPFKLEKFIKDHSANCVRFYGGVSSIWLVTCTESQITTICNKLHQYTARHPIAKLVHLDLYEDMNGVKKLIKVPK